MDGNGTYRGIDLFKLVMAFFVVAIHAGLFTDLDGGLAFITIQVFARMGVPFFFVASGFFFSKGLARRKGGESAYVLGYARKLLGLFAFWAALMLPFWARNGLRAHGGLNPEFLLRLLQTVVFDPGVFWYIEALVVCAFFSLPFVMKGGEGKLLAFGAAFYLFGCFGDSYYGLVKGLPFIGRLYGDYFSVFVHARKGLPFGLLFFSTGILFAKREGGQARDGAGPARREAPAAALAALFALSLVLRYLELRAVNGRGLALDNSISLFAAPPAIILFMMARNARPAFGEDASRAMRSMSSTVFFSHQLMLELIILFVEVTRIQVTASLRFLLAAAMCAGLWLAVSKGKSEFLKRMINS
jgi:serine/alanine racemase